MCAIGRLRPLGQNHSTAHIEPTGLKYSLRGSDGQVDLIKVAYTRLNFAEDGFIPAGENFFSDDCCRFSFKLSLSHFGCRLWYQGTAWTVVELNGFAVILRSADQFKRARAPAPAAADTGDESRMDESRSELIKPYRQYIYV